MTGSLPTGERILLVDDDADELAECATAVESATAATVITETRSRRAAELLRSESFDLVVADMRMPVIDGKDLLKIAHGEDPDLAVVILTGHPSVATAVEMLKLGAADYVLKPVNADELAAVVQRLLAEAPELERLRSRLTATYVRLDPHLAIRAVARGDSCLSPE